MPAKALLFLLLLSFICLTAAGQGQSIRGEVLSMGDKVPLEGVTIENVYTSLVITTNEQGAFMAAANSGQLLEFKKQGFKTARVRIPHGMVPPYFRIILEKGLSPIQDVYAREGNRYDPKADSARYAALYKHELDFPKMSTLDMINHPFSAMSKRNREIWQFQDDYAAFQKEKYVDRTFNAALITKVTGLAGDSLATYMRRYKPTYEQLNAMGDYAFYNFIKATARHYRGRNMPRNAQ
ncbi:MAG: hypothetical protein V4649_14810 [Bacteroidota bacterium]